MIAQVSSSPLQAHRRGIRIGSADPKISSPLVDTVDISLLSTLFGDPVVAHRVFGLKFLSLWFREGDW
jgi:hypothetical protein